jgi:hypothetical protein
MTLSARHFLQARNPFLFPNLGLVIAFAMQFAGVMLVFIYLVLPAVTDMLVARSMDGIFVLAIASTLVASFRIHAVGAIRPTLGAGDHRDVRRVRRAGLGSARLSAEIDPPCCPSARINPL